jgi:hypothetical protein
VYVNDDWDNGLGYEMSKLLVFEFCGLVHP